MKKGIVIGIICLLISVSVIPSTGNISKVSPISKSNNPPNIPSNPNPSNGAIDISICLEVSSAGKPVKGLITISATNWGVESLKCKNLNAWKRN